MEQKRINSSDTLIARNLVPKMVPPSPQHPGMWLRSRRGRSMGRLEIKNVGLFRQQKQGWYKQPDLEWKHIILRGPKWQYLRTRPALINSREKGARI